jgi:cell division transport system permease protein
MSDATQTPDGAAPPPDSRAPVLPQTSASRGPLTIVIAVMCYLASLAFGMTFTLERVAEDWAAGLTESVTVQILPRTGISQDHQREAVIAILEATPGLSAIRPMPRRDAEALLEPWLGAAGLPEDLALPQLVDVRLDADARPDLAALERRLAEEVPGAHLDDHMVWRSHLVAFAGSLQGLALAALALIVVATIAIIAFATRAGIAANREIVEVLHLIGARDGTIAHEVERHFLWLGLRAGAIGAAAAALTLALAALGAQLGAESQFVPGLGADPALYAALIGVPLAAALVSLVTARIATLRALAAMV